MHDATTLQSELIRAQILQEALHLAHERHQEPDFLSSISAGLTYGKAPVSR